MSQYFKLIKYIFFITFFFIIFFLGKNSYLLEPEEFLIDKYQEERAREISKNIRCLVCQNQSIDDSSSLIAKDLRIVIRNKIKQGNSDKEIYKFLTDRYGDFVLLKPPFKMSTFSLWLFPFVLFILAIFIIWS